ncbi:MAG: tetratricopeptide repeat protein [Candidatus Acidiferrales bacterium]
MAKLRTVIVAIVCLSTALALHQYVVEAAPPKPLESDEILALIAGNALPQNIVHAISQNGLAFPPDDRYRSQFGAMGADRSVIAALNDATIAPQAQPIDAAQREVLQYYVTAAQKIKSKDYDAATSEMTALAKSTIDDAGPAFVMGEVLRLEERYEDAAAVYSEVLKSDPEFPETRTKLAYIAYRLGDGDDAVKLANAELASFPGNAEAHKNVGLGLYWLRKFDVAEKEYQEALDIKPGYPAVLEDLALLYDGEGKYKLAIDQYKKAIAVNPTDASILYDLGIAYDHDGKLGYAIPVYRQAIQMDPKMIDAHSNLAHDLQASGLYKEAVPEYRTVEQLAPDSAVCHRCFGFALFETWDFEGAEKEFRTALEIDPGDAESHVGIANIRGEQKRYVEALAEYQSAAHLDGENVDAFRGIGRVDILTKNFVQAADALKIGEEQSPSDANIHDLYAQALLGEGKNVESIQEFKQSLLLDPKQDQVALRLASALEKDGEWAAAVDQYRKTAAAESSVDYHHRVTRDSDLDPQTEYKAAQKRFEDHVTALKSAGRSAEASSLETSVASSAKSPDLSEKLNELMLAGQNAARERNVTGAANDFEEAVTLAQQLQPHDQRLVTAFDRLGNMNLGTNFPAADAAFEQELKAVEEIYGSQSPNMEPPLQSLGTSALLQKNYPAAEQFYFRAVDLDGKVYGESSDRVASALVMATRVYMVQQQYAKAETYLLRAERLDESIYGPDSPNIMRPLWTLCSMYDKWNKPEKAEPCYAHSLVVAQKEFGDSNPQIVPVLTADANALRKLGKTVEADKLEKRAAELQSATMFPPPQR